MKYLFEKIDNSPLIIFRIFFGFLLACEAFFAIATGWVHIYIISPKVSLPFIGLEFLTPLPGYGMYLYYIIMGVLGLLIMIGFRYRYSLFAFTIMWSGVYFMQKATYNNHYYLLLLICIIMLFLPANKYASWDVRKGKTQQELSMPKWCSGVLIAQISIVYFFATLSKFYPDWLDGTFVKLLFTRSFTNSPFSNILTSHWFHLFITYAGILFDGLIIPALLWKRTRSIALIASLIFHLFNSATLQIGIFPYFALSFAVFFYEPERIRQLFFKKKPVFITPDNANISKSSVFLWFFIPYFFIQLALPLRHWFIKGDVLWTEEGHRLSWRMMLRMRDGQTQFKIVDKTTKEAFYYDLESALTPNQLQFVMSKPDAMWQMAQIIKKEYEDKGKEIQIFIESKVSINGKPFKTFINPTIDFSTAKWDYFWHNEWILLYDDKDQPIQH